MSDHREIWLEPTCCVEYENRSWCQDRDMWDHECDPDNTVDPTKYIRADLYESLQAKLDAVKKLERYDTDSFDQYRQVVLADELQEAIGEQE